MGFGDQTKEEGGQGQGQGQGQGHGMVAVGIDKDKGSQVALKWALDNLVVKGQTLLLVHVNTKGHQDEASTNQAKELLLPFRCFCTRKDVQCSDVILEDADIAKAIIDFVSQAAVEKLVLGAPSRGGFRRLKITDNASSISKGAPDFCTVYVIASKGKISSVRNASRPAPSVSHLRTHMYTHPTTSIKSPAPDLNPADPSRINHIISSATSKPDTALLPESRSLYSANDRDSIRSPFSRPGVRGPSSRSPGSSLLSGSDISFVGSDISYVGPSRPSVDRSFPQRLSFGSDTLDNMTLDMPRSSFSNGFSPTNNGYSSFSQDSSSSHSMEDVEAEMKRLRLELKNTMDMYSTACKEALTAKQKAMELHRWKMQDEVKLEEARLAEEAALAMVEKEKAKAKAAMEAAEASRRIAELEAQKRINAEMQAMKESEEKKKALDALAHNDVRYRRYSIEEIEVATDKFADRHKIGEGGYGPVYKCYLDHTPVAVKVLRPDAAQGRSQFQQEVEILSCIRHPNMVLLLGACPEYGCLVYEYMASGSLEDCLFRRGRMPPLSWQQRFRIAAEIGTGLLFLHQTKPEPLVHRDLKPANILLDANHVSKISDVGLARLVPPSVADNVTQYRMTSTAGTFCYIDPEYQQTGMLGTKSDIYSLGIMLLQIITGKPPMGLTHYVERAIEKGQFMEFLDPTVTDWPLEEALELAEVSLKCAELRRKDRPDLGTVVLPLLNRLRNLAEENMRPGGGSNTYSGGNSHVSMQEMLSGPMQPQSGYESRSSASSLASRVMSSY